MQSNNKELLWWLTSTQETIVTSLLKLPGAKAYGSQEAFFVVMKRGEPTAPLLIAHLDVVGAAKWASPLPPPRFEQTSNGVKVVTPSLDDRLGGYIISQLCKRFTGVNLLFTTNEEVGRSTAGGFVRAETRLEHGLNPNVLIQFDRHRLVEQGVFVPSAVMYEYTTDEWVTRLKELGVKEQTGTFSDISLMLPLGVAGINFSCAYTYEHTPQCNADMKDVEKMVEIGAAFIEAYGGERQVHDADAARSFSLKKLSNLYYRPLYLGTEYGGDWHGFGQREAPHLRTPRSRRLGAGRGSYVTKFGDGTLTRVKLFHEDPRFTRAALSGDSRLITGAGDSAFQMACSICGAVEFSNKLVALPLDELTVCRDCMFVGEADILLDWGLVYPHVSALFSPVTPPGANYKLAEWLKFLMSHSTLVMGYMGNESVYTDNYTVIGSVAESPDCYMFTSENANTTSLVFGASNLPKKRFNDSVLARVAFQARWSLRNGGLYAFPIDKHEKGMDIDIQLVLEDAKRGIQEGRSESGLGFILPFAVSYFVTPTQMGDGLTVEVQFAWFSESKMSAQKEAGGDAFAFVRGHTSVVGVSLEYMPDGKGGLELAHTSEMISEVYGRARLEDLAEQGLTSSWHEACTSIAILVRNS